MIKTFVSMGAFVFDTMLDYLSALNDKDTMLYVGASIYIVETETAYWLDENLKLREILNKRFKNLKPGDRFTIIGNRNYNSSDIYIKLQSINICTNEYTNFAAIINSCSEYKLGELVELEDDVEINQIY